MEKQIPRVVRGRTELIVPHKGKELAFVYPSEGPNTYQTVGKGLLNRGLSIPTGYQTASLVHGAYNSQKPEFKEFKQIQHIMENDWLWVFNRNLWTPDGVYVVQDPEAIGISQELNPSDLERRLKGGRDINGVRFNEDVRFAPKGSYKLGSHTPKSLAEDGFIIASFGKEGSKKLAEVSSNFKNNPYILGLNLEKGQEPTTRVSALDSYWGLGDHWLGVDGGFHGYYGDGCAFGV